MWQGIRLVQLIKKACDLTVVHQRFKGHGAGVYSVGETEDSVDYQIAYVQCDVARGKGVQMVCVDYRDVSFFYGENLGNSGFFIEKILRKSGVVGCFFEILVLQCG